MSIAVRYTCGHVRPMDAEGASYYGSLRAATPCRECGPRETVKALDIFGQVHDLGRTESELNGWHEPEGPRRPSPDQGRLL